MRMILCYLTVTPYDTCNALNAKTLNNAFRRNNWPPVYRTDVVNLQIRSSPIFSNGQPGFYAVSFNCDADSRHLIHNLSSSINNFASQRWRSANTGLGLLIATTLSCCLDNVLRSVTSHANLIGRICGGIPNELVKIC